MASTINAKSTGSGGIDATGDASGILGLQTGGVTAMTIDTSQNVGIGTSSPTQVLTVNGRLTFSNLFAAANIDGIFLQSGIGTTVNTATGNNIAFNSGTTERMRINSSGQLLVGSTSGYAGGGTEQLGIQTSGNIAIATKSNTSADYNTVIWSATTSGNNPFVSFATETSFTQRGSITYNRSSGQVAYNVTSDARLKDNIVDAPSALNKIASVKIRSFDWKETGNHLDFGVIAQELIEVSPECVTQGTDNDDGTIKDAWAVDTSALIPAMVKAIQELSAKVDAQQQEINALKGASL